MPPPDRRAVIAGAGLFIAAPAAWAGALAAAGAPPGQPPAVACCIRYAIDPAKRALFEAYGRRLAEVVPRCGGVLLGVFAPHEGQSDRALAVIAFAALADYERYEARVRRDPRAAALARFARKERFILSESRSLFLDATSAPS